MTKKIVVIPGDGIGPEVTEAAVKVLKKIAQRYNYDLSFEEHLAGGTAYDLTGTPLPDSTFEAAKNSDAILFGAVGGPQWDNLPVDLRPEQAFLILRKALDLYINLRPIKVWDSLLENSPLKENIIKGTDILIVRELTGGIYFGDRCESEDYHGTVRAWDVENYTVKEVERITRFAFEAALSRKAKVTSVDKANILATSRLWRKTVEKMAENYPAVDFQQLYIDNCAMQLAIRPTDFDVLVTGNMFGDILSDEAAVLTGSIGLLPSASIGVSTSLYEPIHGSAPDITGKNIANPMAMILSAAMLCRYSLQREDMANDIEKAVELTIAQGHRTADIAKTADKILTTAEITDIICDNL